jgi:hypothetical protein
VEREPVESRSIRSVGFDPLESILEVEFVESGHVYAYYDVPLSVYRDLLEAESLGQYFNEHIKDVYACERLP